MTKHMEVPRPLPDPHSTPPTSTRAELRLRFSELGGTAHNSLKLDFMYNGKKAVKIIDAVNHLKHFNVAESLEDL